MKRLRIFVVGALVAVCSYGTLRGTMPDVATGTWSAVGALSGVRAEAAAAAVPWGDVLVSGGSDASGPLATAEVFRADGRFVPTAPMSVPRAGHAAVSLRDGRVLVMGGRTTDGITATAEVYAAGAWTPVGDLIDARWGHTATVLEDGRVVVAGGENESGALASVEVFDPVTDTFAFAGTMATPRTRHAATRLGDGRVLMAGGRSGDDVLASIDVFQPETGTLAHLANLETPRADLSATTLMDGRVLFAGGSDGTHDLGTTELFDPATGGVAAGTSLVSARSGHLAFLLPDNNAVLIAGGTSAGEAQSTAELYLAWTGQTRTTGAMQAPRAHAVGSALEAVEGRLFVAGGAGLDTADVYAYATVRTDKDDYAPGETVYVSGTGWQPNETVTFGLRELPDEHEARTFAITADASGRITEAELFLVEPHHLGVRFYLTARGAASQAQITFTDDTKLKNNGVTVLGAQTSNPVTPGSSTTYGTAAAGSVRVEFTGNKKAADIGCEVRLTAIGLPVGATATFSPATLTGTETGSLFSLLTISTSGTLTPNTYTFTVRATGTGGTGNECVGSDIETSANVTLVVGAAPAASISGQVYSDANGNGSFDAGEVGVGGVSVTRSGTGTTTTTTDASGAYTFTGLTAGTYTIDYTVPSGFANTGTKPRSVTVASGASSTANDFFAAPQYALTFAAAGLPTGAGSQTGSNVVLTLTIGSTETSYTAADLPVTHTVNSGTVVSYSYAEVVGATAADTRYRRTGVTGSASPVTVTAGATITGEYGRQFKLTLATGPDAGIGGASNPAASPASADGFYDEGSTIGVSAAETVEINADASRWHFTSWTNATGPFGAGSVTMDAAKTVTANYGRQFKLTLTTGPQAGIGGPGNPAASPAPADGYYDEGSTVSVSAAELVEITADASRWRFSSWTNATGAPGAGSVTMDAAKTVTANYGRQFKLTLATGPDAGIGGSGNPAASPVSADGFYDEGSTVSVSAAELVEITAGASRWHFTSWTNATGASGAGSVTMDAAKTVTANYGRQFKLTLATAPQAGIGGAGNPAASPAPADGYYDEGTTVTVTAEEHVGIDAGARWSFASWTNAAGAHNSGTTTMDAAKTVTANYIKEFLVTFAQSGIGGDTGTATVVTVLSEPMSAAQLPASQWIAEGTSVTYAYSAIVAATAGKRYVITAPAPAPASSFLATGALTVTGTYKTQYEVVFAQSGIGSDTGSYPVAQIGGVDKAAAALPFADWYDAGAIVSYSFYTPISTQPASDRQYELSNAASLPSSPVTVGGPATITATYSVNVYGIQFLRPIDQSTAAGVVVNTGKNGRVIPVKVQIVKNGTPVVGTGTIIMRVSGASCGGAATADPVTEYADAGLANGDTNLFRWSPELPGFWIYNLDTRALNLVTNGCYRLDVFMNATTGSSAILLSNSTWALFRPVK